VKIQFIQVVLLFAVLTSVSTVQAQDRPGLFFREDWKEIPPATPVTQAHVSNPDLIMTLYGPGAAGIKKSHHDQPLDDPYYIWSGEAPANWAIALRHRKSLADLRGQAKIRWRSKQSGFRELRLLLKLSSGIWLISDQSDDQSQDWRVREFNVADLRWRRLDITTITEREWILSPDLSSVEEIGWTDLMAGGGSAASSRLDWIEVYGFPLTGQVKSGTSK
jgi:hypothetical protein